MGKFGSTWKISAKDGSYFLMRSIICLVRDSYIRINIFLTLWNYRINLILKGN